MGVYIHIPFCEKKCGYCDFYSITNFAQYKNELLEAIKQDIRLRASFLGDFKPKTIYFGGGTPSLYSPLELQEVINIIKEVFDTNNFAEITVELNPEDLTSEYINKLKSCDFNRVSLGIQSFNDDTLTLMNRRHNAQRAIDAVKELKNNGFDNISIDLIYGVHNTSIEDWESDLEIAMSLDIQHISSYHLSIEEGTPFGNLLKKGKIKIVDEALSEESYELMVKTLSNNGFCHYEISNFAIDEAHISKHNSAYWVKQPYLGVGPSAHSFDGDRTRAWCVSSVKNYIKGVQNKENYIETEILEEEDLYCEFIMLSLRQLKGIDLNLLKSEFPSMYDTFLSKVKRFIDSGDMIISENRVKIAEKSILLADYFIKNCI